METTTSSRPLMGIFWMLVTGLLFVAVTALVKYMGPRVPPAEMAFLRYVLGLVFLLPMLRSILSVRLTRRQWMLFGARGVFHTLGVILWFYAMVRIPLAEVTALNYLAPVYVSVLAVFVLGEKIALRRIMAIGAAFVGAIVILRPGFREIDQGHIAMLFAAIVFAGGYLSAKILSDEVPASIVVAMLSIFVTIGLAPFAAADWVTPTQNDLALLFLVACFAVGGHYTMTLAFAAAPLTVTQPVTFLQLVWATALGALVFAEAVDIWVLLGGGLILASVTFITWREAVLRRRPITPAGPATKL